MLTFESTENMRTAMTDGAVISAGESELFHLMGGTEGEGTQARACADYTQRCRLFFLCFSSAVKRPTAGLLGHLRFEAELNPREPISLSDEGQ